MRPLLETPCAFCGYKGERYWQPDSHAKDCPWRNVGGYGMRSRALRSVIATMVKDKRTLEEKIADGVKFVMGPGGDEGTRMCTCHKYPHTSECGSDGDSQP